MSVVQKQVKRRNCGCSRDGKGYSPCRTHDGMLKELEIVSNDLGLYLRFTNVTVLVA